MDKSSVIDEIRRKALAYQLDPEVMTKIGQIESQFNPNAKAKSSSAAGVFQFTDRTGNRYGLTNPYDASANIDAGMRLAIDNKSALSKALGRDPTGGELYLAHQQGAGGARNLLSRPNEPAVNVVGRQAVLNNGGTPDMTAAQFAAKWTQKIDGQGLAVTARNPTPPDPGMFAEAQPQSMGMAPQPQQNPRMSPDDFRQSVFNGPAVSNNEALDYRLKEDAAQRGYASWNPRADSPTDAPANDPFAALKGMFPQGDEKQAMLAKILSGNWG